MANLLQVKRGLKSNLPSLNVGEPAFTTDVGEFYVGDGGTNYRFIPGDQYVQTTSDVSFNSISTSGASDLGNDASSDVHDLRGLTTIHSGLTKTAGSSASSIFDVIDSESTELFSVKENGDTVIGGILTVNGSGTSTFAGSVDIGGKLTVDETANVTGDMSGDNLTLSGNLVVNGNTTLGDQDADTISFVGTANTDLDMGANKITALANPISDNDAANKSYVDAIEQGLDIKHSVRIATDGANIDLSSSDDPGNIDGKTLSNGDRILLKDQTDASENGIYDAVTAIDPTTWTRSEDTNTDANVTSGMFTFVEEGDTNDNRGFVLVSDSTVTVGTTDLIFSQFSGAGQIAAGTGLSKSGDTIYHNAASVHESGGALAINHDNLNGFISNEHIDWTSDQGVTNVNDSNVAKAAITQYSYTYNDLSLGIDDTPIDGETTQPVTSNWAYDHTNAVTGIHGVSGNVVGTTDTQTLSNKTIDCGAF